MMSHSTHPTSVENGPTSPAPRTLWQMLWWLLRRPGFWFGFLLAVLGFVVCWSISLRGIQADTIDHTKVMMQFLGEKALPGHFLYHLTVLTAALLTPDFYTLLWVSCVVLGLSLWAKYAISRYVIAQAIGPDARLFHTGTKARTQWWISLSALGLVFCFNLPIYMPLWRQMYRGQFSPNVWHSPTLIFLMPLAIALLYCSYRFLQKGRLSLLWWIGLFSLLNVLAKPSFFVVFCLVFPFFSFYRYRFSRYFFLSLVPLFVVGCVVIAQYLYIYHSAGFVFQKHYAPKPSRIGFDFLGMWRYYTRNPLASFLASVALPLGFVLLYPARAWRSLLFRYTASLFAVAFVMYCTIREFGPRAAHGNFVWQLLVCNYLLFLVALREFVKGLSLQRGLTKKDGLFLLLFGLHVASGLLYLIKIFVTGDYN